jgi:hypothetical protein
MRGGGELKKEGFIPYHEKGKRIGFRKEDYMAVRHQNREYLDKDTKSSDFFNS